MKKILLVEDSKVYSLLIKRSIEAKLSFEVVCAYSYWEAHKIIKESSSDFFVGLLDLSLPDAPDGEIVDAVISKGIPSIVFTSKYSEEIRAKILSKKVIDYVIKEGQHNIDYIVSLIRRVYRNQSIGVLVVDDSSTSRLHASGLLKNHLFKVYEASSGAEALEILEENKDIKMVVTDYTMPEMDGFQLIKEIRKKFSKEKMSIIGISGSGSSSLSAKFIKNGANDFITKPLLNEEFHCRVSQNIELIEYIAELKDASSRDFLTGLYNRRHFFDSGNKLYGNARRGHFSLTVALIDIDHFKKVNDAYGHDVGDAVLKEVSSTLKNHFRESDIVSRFGGEEFCVLAIEMVENNVFKIFDELRKSVESKEIKVGDRTIKVTISIGISNVLEDSLETMISRADARLYEAKESGRNRVVFLE